MKAADSYGIGDRPLIVLGVILSLTVAWPCRLGLRVSFTLILLDGQTLNSCRTSFGKIHDAF
jgi:hypothetical protein